jgi:hypothetical protein
MRHFVLGIQELTRIEQDRRTFQEGIDRAQRVIEQTLALISDAHADRGGTEDYREDAEDSRSVTCVHSTQPSGGHK